MLKNDGNLASCRYVVHLPYWTVAIRIAVQVFLCIYDRNLL